MHIDDELRGRTVVIGGIRGADCMKGTLNLSEIANSTDFNHAHPVSAM